VLIDADPAKNISAEAERLEASALGPTDANETHCVSSRGTSDCMTVELSLP